MERDKALEIIKPHLTEHRFVHTVGVMETAIMLADMYGADVEKAELAAIFHDYAKFRPKQEMKELILSEQLGTEFLYYGDELLHAPCGAFWVKAEVGITDEDVLLAIRYHTTGRRDMSLLEKVVFLADYIEPNRQFPGVEEVRKIAKESLDDAIVQSLKNTIQFLLLKSAPIFPDTLHTYNELVQRRKTN